MPEHEPSLPSPDPGELLARAMHTDPPSGAAGRERWTPPAPEEVAALLPQYRIEGLLGHGGMGAVYRGVQTALDRPIALKLLPIEIGLDPAFAERFHREARTLARLNHPNIVGVHDFGKTSEGHLYFTMEFVEGTDLHRIIHGPGLTPAQTFEIIIGVCEALAYAHGKGVVHRDIKPANVLVSTEGQVKVADFGLARRQAADKSSWSETGTGTVMGTPAYMAPEQMGGQHVDHRADIYSLGVMLYEMLCGEVPRGVFDPPSRKVAVDSRVDEVVHKAMQSEPDRRYQQTSEMKLAVDRIRTSSGGGAPPPEVPAAPRRASRQRIAILVAACLALASAAGFFIWEKVKPSRVTRAAAEHGSAAESSPALQRVEPSATTGRPDGLKPPTTLPAASAAAPTVAIPREWLISKTASVPPPADALEFQGSKYKVFAETLPWLKAKAKAELMGGHLATITSTEEASFVKEKFGLNLKTEGSWFWIGAATPDSKEPWRWVTGESWVFTEWHPDEPNFASSGKPTPVLFAVGVRKGGTEPFFRWIEYPITAVSGNGYLVEWDRFSAADAAANDPAKWKDWLADARAQGKTKLGSGNSPLDATGWHTDNNETFFPDPKNRDYMARLRFAGELTNSITISLRRTSASDGASLQSIAFRITRKSVGLALLKFDTKADRIISDTQLTPPVSRNVLDGKEPHTLEARAIDDLLLLLLDGELLLSARDATLKKGSTQFQIVGTCLITELATQSLDAPAGNAPQSGTGVPPVKTAQDTGATPVPPSAPATPKPPSEMEKWLAGVDGPQQAAFKKDVLQPFESGLAGLRGRYTAALERAMAELSRAGKLEEALAHRTERDTFAKAQTLPPDDAAPPSAAIQKLRTAYRTEAAKLDQTRLTAAKALHAKYDAVLAQSQTALTQRHRLDDALLLKNHRDTVKAAWLGGAATPPVAATSPSQAVPAASPPRPGGADAARTTGGADAAATAKPRPVVPKYPKGDDRKAAEWVLSVGGTVDIQVGSTTTKVTKSDDLPRGRFALVRVRLFFPASGPPQPIENLEPLAGLEELAHMTTRSIRFRDEQLAPLTSLP